MFPVWFFDPILRELVGRALGCNDNTRALTAPHARAELQDEASGRARRRWTPRLGRRRIKKDALIVELIDGNEPLRLEGTDSVDLVDRFCF